MQATALALCFLTACPAAVAANGHADGVVGLAILKQPRVGSTWVKKELNQLPGVHLEFEPLTDGTNRCPSNFTNGVLGHMLREPLRCVNRKSRSKHCYWVKSNCSTKFLWHHGGPANKSASAISVRAHAHATCHVAGAGHAAGMVLLI